MHEDFEAEARRIKEEIGPAIRSFDRTRKLDLLFLLIVTPLLWLITIPLGYFMVLPRTSFLDNPEISLEFILPAIIIAFLETISVYGL